MNVEKINELADFMDTLVPHQFDIRDWSMVDGAKAHPSAMMPAIERACGCIGGWGNALFNGSVCQDIREVLGIDVSVAHELFFPMNQRYTAWTGAMARDPQKAARVLRELAKTGRVDWSV